MARPCFPARRPVSPQSRRLVAALVAIALGLAAPSVRAAGDPQQRQPATPAGADKVHVLDGSRVLTAGRLYVNITNWGLIGSRYSEISSYSDAPSGQWPGGTSNEYVFAAGLWIGGILGGQYRVSTGQPEAELRPSADPRATIYEAREEEITEPPGNPGASGVRFYREGGDDDGDGRLDEEILDGMDQDGDGLVDEDFGQLGTQMLVATMADYEPLARAMYPDHDPLHVKVVQRAFAYQTPEQENFVVLAYDILNDGAEAISDVYVGMWMDGDVGKHGDYSSGRNDLAGTFDGYIHRPEGYFAPVRTAYMWDGAESGALPGWCGVTLIHHTVDHDLIRAPGEVRLRAARVISPAGTIGGGPPLNDADRYTLMAEPGHDPEVDPHHTGDYQVLVSAGPFPSLAPGERITVEFAICIGEGLDGLLESCAAAMTARHRLWTDLDGDPDTGVGCKEYKIWAEDFYPVWNSPQNPVFARNSYLWDTRCLPRGFLYLPDILPESFTIDPVSRRHFMYVNGDFCEECSWSSGTDCLDLAKALTGGKDLDPAQFAKSVGTCTGVGGRETPVPWTVGNAPPPSPHVRVVDGDGGVELFWDDRSVRSVDTISGLQDFESYRIWRSDGWDRPPGSSESTGPRRDSWHLVQEYDIVNDYTVWYDTPDGTVERVLELGPNTGLDPAAYVPVCLNDPQFAGLSAAMHEVVLADTAGFYDHRPALRDLRGVPVPGLEGLLPWEDHPAVLDTFFEIIERPEAPGVVAKPRRRYYHYLDDTVTNGFIYFYSVTATDHTTTPGGGTVTGRGIGGAAGASFVVGHPRQDPLAAGDRDRQPYAYPNPATRESLAEFQAMHPNSADPTGVRIAFANLPPVLCEIQIYTLAGDLVQTVTHDAGQDGGEATWNLITRNGQEIVSGIYLFVVVPREPGYSQEIGKFVVVR